MVFGKDKKEKENMKPKNKAAADKESSAAPKAPPVVGATSGVSVSETWIGVFEKNEQVEEGDRRTDEQISEFMKNEFPGTDPKAFDRMEIARGKYNRGGFHKKDKSGRLLRPKIHSRSHAGLGQGEGDGADRSSGSAKGGASKKETAGKFQRDFKSHKK